MRSLVLLIPPPDSLFDLLRLLEVGVVLDVVTVESLESVARVILPGLEKLVECVSNVLDFYDAGLL